MGRPSAASLIFALALGACDTTSASRDAGEARDGVAPEASGPLDASTPDASAGADASVPNDADVGDGAVDIDAMAEKGMGMIEELTKLIQANQADCVVLGDRLTEYSQENDAFITDAKQVYGTMGKIRRKEVQKRYRPRFDAAWHKLQPIIKRCKDDPKMKVVLDRFF